MGEQTAAHVRRLTERMAHSIGQETAALRDFDLVYDRFESVAPKATTVRLSPRVSRLHRVSIAFCLPMYAVRCSLRFWRRP